MTAATPAAPSAARLSIIIPARNEAAHMAATLQPLQPLRANGVEVIVVDGGSSDHTVAAAQPLSDRYELSIEDAIDEVA